MKPILYTADCKNKVAFLSETVSCLVTEERNGAYQLELEYPISGQYFSEITEGLVIKAKPNQKDPNQFFRIYEITKPLSGLITIYANHISYDMSGYPLSTFSLDSASAATTLTALLGKANAFRNGQEHFTLGSCDINTLASVNFRAISVRAAIGGTEGSVLDSYDGEFKFNNFSVSLFKNRGQNNGVRISYGKNLTEMKLSLNMESSYTGIFPYIMTDETYITLPDDGVISVDNISGIAERILLLNCTEFFDDNTEKNQENLRIVANEYLSQNDINAIAGSMTVEMVDLSKSAAFDNYAKLEEVNLCDTVKVINPKYGVSTSMKVIKTVYDTLRERYEKLELGTPKSSFATTIQQAVKTANDAYNKASSGTAALVEEFNQAINDATAQITENLGGYVRLDPMPNPQRILIMDNADKTLAQKVWQWNIAGLAYSSSGIDGPYGTSILGEDGKLILNNATVGSISANLIRAGSIISEDGNMIINLDTGSIVTTSNGFSLENGEVTARKGKIGGWTIKEDCLYSDYGDYRAYIQTPTASKNWVFSTQKKLYDGDTWTGAYEGTFIVNANGTLQTDRLYDLYDDSMVARNDQNQYVYGYGAYTKNLDTFYYGGNNFNIHTSGSEIKIQSDRNGSTRTNFKIGGTEWNIGGNEAYREHIVSNGGFVISANNGSNAMYLIASTVNVRGNINITGTTTATSITASESIQAAKFKVSGYIAMQMYNNECAVGIDTLPLSLYGSKIKCKATLCNSAGTAYQLSTGTVEGLTTASDTGDIVIPSDFMDYFVNSDITISPTQILTTAEHTAYIDISVDEETGEIIETPVIIPEHSETVEAGVDFTSLSDTPDILIKDEGVDMYSMMCLMWKGIQNLHSRLTTIEGAPKND